MFAHEIRTALTGILALGELLAASGLGERERQWAVAVKDAAEHLSALTTLIVEAERAATQRLDLGQGIFHLGLFANAIAASLAARAAAKGLTAAVSIPAKLPERVRGDAVRLRAALENLIDNAVKFTERGTVGLDVRAKTAPRGEVELSFVVSDTGLGIDAAAVRRLFRPYAQATADVARLYGGAGLGLVSVKRIAKAMRGDLTIVSKPGAGSRFRLDVKLPRARAAPHTRGAPPSERGRRRLHVLCAEDNPFARVILDTILTELGHRAVFAASGEAAVEAVAGGAYDVVMMDIMLPTLDGLSAARRIRALPGRAGAVPIVGFSGRTNADDEAKALAAGMDVYLRKPVSPQALAAALARVPRDIAAQSDS